MSADTDADTKGPLAWMAHNTVAANLLMILIIAGGVFGIFRTKQEVFPAFTLDVVTVAVPYPGASPAEVEQGIVLAVEEEVRGIIGVKRVTSVAREGAASVGLELMVGADADRVLSDVKTAVDRIQSFPEEAEEPSVSLMEQKRTVVSLILAGDQRIEALQAVAERARERLLAHPDITQVDVQGVRDLEIHIEVPRAQLEALGLTLDQVAAQIRAASLELPGGSVKTDGGEVLLRVADRRLEGHGFADIVLRGTQQGAQVRLGDVATIRDGYAEDDLFAYYNGQPAVRLVAYRIGDETPTRVATAVAELADELQAEMPDGVEVALWDDDSKMLESRIDLLVRNARMGLVLVFLVLTAFLDLRLALWVGLGIPISIMGAFSLMPTADVSINMVSLFAFIVTLGMVVDDAIVVGENVYDKETEGAPRMQAAVEGAREMIVPVTFSILTTIVAFSPLLMVPGFMGKIFRIMPLVVILVLLFSWVESFWVLPSHLGHDYSTLWRLLPGPVKTVIGWIDRARQPFANGLVWFNERVYAPALELALAQRYAVVGACLAIFIVAIGSVASGAVAFSFFPKLEGDVVTATARLPYGTPVEQTAAVQRTLEEAVDRAVRDLGDPEGLVRGMYTSLGQEISGGGPGGGTPETGSHLVSVQIQLSPSEERELSAQQFAAAWSQATPPMAGIEALKFNSSSGPGGGAAVDVQLASSSTEELAAASEALLQELRTYPQLTDHENSYASGKPQLDFHLAPAATSLGLTANDLARQLRASFYGAEALREQRGRHEVKVMVRLPAEQRDSERDIEQVRIVRPSGEAVPLSTVASVERRRAPTEITREDGRRIVNVSAELAPGVASSREVLEALQAGPLNDLRERFPGVSIEMAGEQREQGEVASSLFMNTLLVMIVMYAMLAIPFKSYIQPIIVMMAIPMGYVGAVGGHVLMGYPLSMISFFGIIALSGVVVNDSLVLIDATNQKRRSGVSAYEAVRWGGTRRLRPILLTSLTTFFGLAPMITETSMQARFLIPMAISLGFGVLFATFVILLMVPALYLIVDDVTWLAGRVVKGLAGPPPAASTAPPEAAR
jgi:multidrug efflux pump subunit AcrB